MSLFVFKEFSCVVCAHVCWFWLQAYRNIMVDFQTLFGRVFCFFFLFFCVLVIPTIQPNWFYFEMIKKFGVANIKQKKFGLVFMHVNVKRCETDCMYMLCAVWRWNVNALFDNFFFFFINCNLFEYIMEFTIFAFEANRFFSLSPFFDSGKFFLIPSACVHLACHSTLCKWIEMSNNKTIDFCALYRMIHITKNT